jgi:hypothetical protein
MRSLGAALRSTVPGPLWAVRSALNHRGHAESTEPSHGAADGACAFA